jgi:predicted nucleotidyltransferase
MTPATLRKRQELGAFIERLLAPEPAVQAVIAIGSVANGRAQPNSDIDALLFLDPYDEYIVPAESKWRPTDSSFHSIFEHVEDAIQLDFHRLDLTQWADPAYEWPEERRAELAAGWLAFDRSGRVRELIAERTAYTDEVRLARLDEAILWLDQHLSDDRPRRNWESLGPAIAHDRLQAAYEYLVQGLFAYNRHWRPWRNRQASALLALPWLPERFADRILPALNAPSLDEAGYQARAEALRGLVEDLVARLVADGVYGPNPTSEAFIRGHDEPGRAWNMDAWNRRHRERA